MTATRPYSPASSRTAPGSAGAVRRLWPSTGSNHYSGRVFDHAPDCRAHCPRTPTNLEASEARSRGWGSRCYKVRRSLLCRAVRYSRQPRKAGLRSHHGLTSSVSPDTFVRAASDAMSPRRGHGRSNVLILVARTFREHRRSLRYPGTARAACAAKSTSRAAKPDDIRAAGGHEQERIQSLGPARL